MSAQWQSALTRAQAHAPFLALAMRKLPDLVSMLERGEGEAALSAARNAGKELSSVEAALRRERLALSLVLAIGDLAGAFPLERVMRELSDLADRSLDCAIGEAIRRRVPDAEPQGFVALALGKQGAGELNYSSDIDPILLFDPQTLPRRERDDPGEAAQRYARNVVEILSRPAEDGFVFRVDLRLRPASEISPLAIPVEAALVHYESSALAWERAAFIRARACAGDIARGQDFLDAIRPFVWRRSLDFTAIEEIRRLTARIRQAYDGPIEPGPGFDIKRGRGGIREVEFFAQTHQLIYGGRDPSLRERGTRAALDALAAAGIVPAEQARLLGESYDRLRTIEHRLQMVEDRQTHSLPESAEAIEHIAMLDGLESGDVLIDELRGLCAGVAELYDSLLGEDGEETSASDRLQPGDPLAERASKWPETIRSLRGTEARAALDAILPVLAEGLAAAPDPERALVRWETFLTKLPSAVNLFRLFEQRPGLLEQVLRVLTLADPLAEELARRPELLDRLIDRSALDLPEGVQSLVARMTARESDADYEFKLGRLRQVVGEERFALGVQLIEARHDPLAIAGGLAQVAEAAIATAGEAAREEFARAHGRVPGDELLILGLGRLGGQALTHASDLDLVYLFSGDIGVESDGRRPLTASLYFNRLAQRVTAALSVPTAEGALYEIDTRLRPQGAHGPPAVSLASFAEYQTREAWTWEHMALCRARPVFGSSEARAKLAAIVDDVLQMPRDADELRDAVLKMRSEIAEHKPPKGPLDAKLQRGGLVDCEFIVHYLQLRERRGFAPALDAAIDQLTVCGLLPESFAGHHALLTRQLVAARLLAPAGDEPPPAARAALAQACHCADFSELLQRLADARQGVAATWADLFGEKLEIER